MRIRAGFRGWWVGIGTLLAINTSPVRAYASTETVPFPASESGHLLLRPPDEAPAGRRAPVLFFYHGQNGSPSVDLPLRHGVAKDWIVVGMGYRKKPDGETPEQKKAADVAYFESALALVSKSAPVDPALVFVGGISAGGWHASLLLEDHPKRIAGAVLLASGRARLNRTLPTPGSLRGKTVFIGTGRDDPNLYPACEAAEVYRLAGAEVYREEYEGVGHAPPPQDRNHLTDWLAARGLPVDSIAAVRHLPNRPGVLPDEIAFWTLVARDIQVANVPKLMLPTFQALQADFARFPDRFPQSPFRSRLEGKTQQLAKALSSLPPAPAASPAPAAPTHILRPPTRMIPGPPKVNRKPSSG